MSACPAASRIPRRTGAQGHAPRVRPGRRTTADSQDIHHKECVMQKENARVLGRTLAVEEMKDVSGAAPTTTLWDTTTRLDQTSRQEDSLTLTDL